LGFDKGPSTAGFTADVTLFVIGLPQNQNFMFVIVLCGQLQIYMRIFLDFFLFITLFNTASSARPSDSTASEDAGIESRTVAN
jgi:hypothetical protein